MRSFKLGVLTFMAALAAPMLQAAEVPYDHAAFENAVHAGKPVAVVFHADWCPTCRAQAPVLKQLAGEPKYQDLTLYVADFDKETALKKELHVVKQSTIVVFNKGKELSRATGTTDHDGLNTVLSGAGS